MDLQIQELTPPGAGGVSVIELRGPGVVAQLESWGCGRPEAGRLRLVQVTLGDEVLDEALLCGLSEERAELHVHGSRPLVKRLLEEASTDSTRIEPVDRGGVPSVAERARRALARAPGRLGARLLLDQVEGAWARECARLAEATDDELARGLAHLAERSARMRHALEPARVLLAGPVNAGKSTLFNALVGEERAITSHVEGTTRDLVTERVHLGPWPVDLVDSAGQRNLEGDAAEVSVERAGQQLARDQAARVDWILWLDPAGGPAPSELTTLAGPRVTVLGTCRDREGADPSGISALHEPAEAAARVRQLFETELQLESAAWQPGEALAIDGWTRDLVRDLQGLPPELARSRLALEGRDQEETGPGH